jgi:hypothetical protein
MNLCLAHRLGPRCGIVFVRQVSRRNQPLVSFFPIARNLDVSAREVGDLGQRRSDRVETLRLSFDLSCKLRPGRLGDVPQFDVTPGEAPAELRR